jgi:hypothetical protein
MSDNQDESTEQLNELDAQNCPIGCRVVPSKFDTIEKRADSAQKLRKDRADILRRQPLPQGTLCNFEENDYSDDGVFIAMFSKGLSHNRTTGEVNRDAYCALLRGLKQDTVKGFDREVGPHLGCNPTLLDKSETSKSLNVRQVSLETTAVGNQLRFVNPLSAQGFNLAGIDSQQIQLFKWGEFDSNNNVKRENFPKPPRFNSEEIIREMAEVYWMALCRDIPFRNYRSNAITQAAAIDLANNFSYPNKDPFRPEVNKNDPETLFRGFTEGDKKGPYLSQFYVRPVPIAAITGDPRIRTLKRVRDEAGNQLEGKDYLVSFDEWLGLQKGCTPVNKDIFDDPVLPRNGRDIAQYVHVDLPLEQFINACLIISTRFDPTAPPPPGLVVPRDSNDGNLVGGGMSDETGFNLIDMGNPYNPLTGGSKVQDGFGTLGRPDFKVLISEVAKRALLAAWYQKWSVHRRLRPEEFGGRIDVHLRGIKSYRSFHSSIKDLGDKTKGVLKEINAYNQRYFGQDTFLLPQEYVEGCPLHPAYPQGHATVAGACVTILKALTRDVKLVNENIAIVEPNADGTELQLYDNRRGDINDITLHGELNKLASNTGLARDIAGVHYRSDYTNGLRLGEAVAIWYLCDIRNTYEEEFSFKFNTFDNHQITIDNRFASCFQTPPERASDEEL